MRMIWILDGASEVSPTCRRRSSVWATWAWAWLTISSRRASPQLSSSSRLRRCRLPARLATGWPVLDAMAGAVFHVGAVGAGVRAKIISNFLGTSNVALVREALRMAAGAGIGEKEILRIIEDGGVGSSWVSNNWQRIRTQEENYTTGKEGMVEMWAKDLRLAQNLAAVNNVPAPIVDFIVAKVLPEVGANGLTG